MPITVFGSDGHSPQYDPDARWTQWNKNEIYFGAEADHKYVPKVGDWVIDTGANITSIVISLDPLTLIPTLKPVNETDSGTDLLGEGNDTYRVYYDNSVIPYVLAVDARLEVGGTQTSYAKIFRGTDIGPTGKLLSFLFDTQGNFLTNNIPLELKAIDNHDNHTAKVVSVCHTKEILIDAERVTVVIYNDQGHVVAKKTLKIEATSFIRGVGANTKYISHLSIQTPFLNPNDTALIDYPINVPLQAFNVIGVVNYSDGSTQEYPVDGVKFKLLGLERFVGTVPGQRIPLVLAYNLTPTEIAYGNVSVDGKVITQPYHLVTTVQNGAFSVKLFGYPYWNINTNSYQMRWFMMDLNRNIMFEVSAYISYNQNSDIFNSDAINVNQNLSVRLNLKDVSNAFPSYIHTQTLNVIIRTPGVTTGVWSTNWLVGFEQNQTPFYGGGLNAKIEMVNQNLYKLNIRSDITLFQDWIDKVYIATKPIIDIKKETTPLTPTHFVVFNDTGARTEFPITDWDKDLMVGMVLKTAGTQFIEFIRKTNTDTLRLGVSGLAIKPA